MDNTREKLIELVNNVLRCLPWGEISSHTAGDVADHLIANGVTIQKWIPVTERLPDKHGKYLTVVPSRWVGVEHGIWVIWYHPKSGFYDSDPEWGDIEMDDVTHWMPLPSTEGLE